jgi:hypothetical protein
MRNRLVSALTSCLLLLATAGMFVFAETQAMVATIPFDFIVGKTALPAGDYKVGNVSAGSPALLIRSVDGRSAVMVVTHGARSAAGVEGKMVFNRYGDRYFLSQVFSPGSGVGRQIPKSRLEHEVASNPQRPTTEHVALSVR